MADEESPPPPRRPLPGSRCQWPPRGPFKRNAATAGASSGRAEGPGRYRRDGPGPAGGSGTSRGGGSGGGGRDRPGAVFSWGLWGLGAGPSLGLGLASERSRASGVQFLSSEVI